MKISFNWLSTIIDTSQIETHDLANKLTLAGFEVDSIEYLDTPDNKQDIILDVATPANRGDTLSVRGLAREIAAFFNLNYSLEFNKHAFFKKKEDLIQLKNLKDCLFYSITVIDKIKIQTSPEWLQKFLKSIGISPQNNISDILNYILIEYGQPLEIFDLEKILPETKSLLTFEVGQAKTRSKFLTRNSEEVYLNQENLVSKLNGSDISISGIVSSQSSDIVDSTSSIILETAIFLPTRIRQSCLQLNIRTEASLRFERSINPELLNPAYGRALDLITMLTGGHVVSANYMDALIVEKRNIKIYFKNIEYILGNAVFAYSQVEEILQRLGFICKKEIDGWLITIPNHRANDIEREIDIIEEIGRIYGFNKFPHILPTLQDISLFSVRSQVIKQVRNFFISKGFSELVHYSFQNLIKNTNSLNIIRIKNPLTIEQEYLRNSILPELIDTFLYNCAQGNNSFNGFEIGRVFSSQKETVLEEEFLGGILGGHLVRSSWSKKAQPLNWFEAKGIIENFFQLLNIQIRWTQSESSRYSQASLFHKFRWAILQSNHSEIGIFGQLTPRITKKSNLASNLYLFEINLEFIIKLGISQKYYHHTLKPYSLYPTVSRDINMLVPISITIENINKTINQVDNNLFQSAQLFDDYRDINFKNQRRLSFRLFFRSQERTLTVEEVDSSTQEIKDFLSNQLNIPLEIS
uniref:phenylalanyl-tRNA synthetase beta subunit n=1 Tax=Rhodospora sordida TaxID=362230 RepID=UPI001FCE01BA|nr:phenylalanyl-tRNA synthetase beta subunit [Rhodospora sordida]UNJ14928.1 phenylalanyl-tRNA synthetase beta subunit [Rhodospora sordida]